MNRLRRTSTATLRSVTGTALVTLLVLSGCVAQQESNEITRVVIGGLDYTFDVPDPIPSGQVEFVFENRGQVRHELHLLELAPGTTLAELAEAPIFSPGREGAVRRDAGILVAEPGEEAWGRLRAELAPGGTYGLVCRLRDARGAQPHQALGMIRTFQAD